MTLHPVDWIIVVVYLFGCVVAGVWMKRFIRGVEDFAVAGREMDVNLGIASLAATEVGIVTVMYTAQMGFTNGFAGAFPGVVTAAAMFLVGLTGFVIGPMRNTGVITIPELFEKRFGTRVRWLAGLVVILGGVLNMGIFLRLGGEFLVHMTGLPKEYLEWMMTALLALVLVYTVLGGMLSVLITDYLQFLVMGLGIVITSVLVIAHLGWTNIVADLTEAREVSVAQEDALANAKEASEAAEKAFLAAELEPPAELPPWDRKRLASERRTLAWAEGALRSKEEGRLWEAAPALPRAGAAVDFAVLAPTEALAGGGEPGAVSGFKQLSDEVATQARELARQKRRALAEAADDAAGEAGASAEAAGEAAGSAEAAGKELKESTGAVEDAVLRLTVAERVAMLAAEKQRQGDQAVTAEVLELARSEAQNARARVPKAQEAQSRAQARFDRRGDAARQAAEKSLASVDRAVIAAEKIDHTTGGLKMAEPFNPLSSNGLGWALWQTIFALAVVTTWQTTIARVLAAKDSRTARKVYCRTAFYWVGRFALPGLWGVGAFLYFYNRGGLPDGVESINAMPEYLKIVLPTGIVGIMLAAMLAAEMSTDSGYLLTWATVIYNDIFSPLLRRPLPEKGRLLAIRILVLAIGLFLVFYGLWYELPGGAWDYLAVTGNIYLASLFTLLVAALYWPASNSWGAISAIVLGAIGPITFLVVNAIVPKGSPWQIAPEVAGFASFGMAIGGMIVGSLVANAAGRGFSGPIGADTSTHGSAHP